MKRARYVRRLDVLVKKYGEDNVVYFDESGFKQHMGRLSGWAQKGQKLYCDVKGKREKKTNLLMAQRGKDWLAPFVFTGSCTAKLVTRWVHALLPLPPYSPDLNPIEQSFGTMKKRWEGMKNDTTIEKLVMSYY